MDERIMRVITLIGLFTVYSIATWRLTRLIVKEDGPFDLIGKFRDFIGVYYDEKSQCVGRNVFAKGLCCMKCTSVWAAIPFAIVTQPMDVGHFAVLILAYSGAALMIDRWYEG